MSSSTTERIQKKLMKLFASQLRGNLMGSVVGFFEGLIQGLEQSATLEEEKKKELERIANEIVQTLENKVALYEHDLLNTLDESIQALAHVLDTIN